MTAQTRFGRYTILGPLGAGGFAQVYRAWDPALTREVALKALLPHLADDPGLYRRFIAEAQALAALRHPHIVAVYDVGDEGGRPFFTMELLRGFSLADAVNGQAPWPLARVIELVRPLASALDALHAADLVHRDIKPANIMLEQSSRVVLMDLGIARSLSATDHTATGTTFGTPSYMAPEQAQGLAVTPATDVYALGVLVYHLLAGRPPFLGPTPAVLYAQVYTPPPPLVQFRPDVPAPVSAALAAALAKDPEERPISAEAFVEALVAPPHEEVATQTDQPTVRWDAAAQAPTVRIPPATAPVPTTAAPVLAKRWNRALGLRLAAVLIGLLGVAVAVLIVHAVGGTGAKHPAVVSGQVAQTPVFAATPPTPTMTATPVTATAATAAVPTFSNLQIHNADAWGAGQGSLQICFHFAQGGSGAAARLRVASADDPSTPIVPEVVTPLAATVGDPCSAVPPHGVIPAGNYVAELLDAQDMQRASYQFAVVAVSTTSTPAATPTVIGTPPAQPPRQPYIDAVTPLGAAQQGQPFDFDVVARNGGVDAGKGSVTIGSPSGAALSVRGWDCGAASTAVTKQPGDPGMTVFTPTPHTETTKQPLVEVDFDRLPAGSQCTVHVRASGLRGSVATFNLRVTVIAPDGSITTWPNGGSTLDQQGLPAERWEVPVRASTAPAPSPPSVDRLQAAVAEVESHGYRVADTSTYQPAAQLHVLIGVKTAAPDAGVRLAFFFLEDSYLGTDTLTPSANLSVIGHDSTTVTLRYALYRPSDDACCPSAGAATVRYRWNGEQLVQQDPIPTDASDASSSRR